MYSSLRNSRAIVLASFLIVVPFFIAEAITTNGFVQSGFPFVLFAMMFVNALLFVGVAHSALQDIRRHEVGVKIGWFVLKVVTVGILWYAWVHIVMDQMPCFLGATGC